MSPRRNQTRLSDKRAASSGHFSINTTNDLIFEPPSSLFDNPKSLPARAFVNPKSSNNTKKAKRTKYWESKKRAKERLVRIDVGWLVNQDRKRFVNSKKKVEKTEKQDWIQDVKLGKELA